MAGNGDKSRETTSFQRLESTQDLRPTTTKTEPVNRFKVHQGGRAPGYRRRTTEPLDVRELFNEQESAGLPSTPTENESGHEILAYVGGKPLSWEDIERLADQESLADDSSEAIIVAESVKPRRMRRLVMRGAIAASVVAVCAVTYATYGVAYLRAHSPEAAAKRDLVARSAQSLELTERSPLDDLLEPQPAQFIFITERPPLEADRSIEPAIVENDVRNALNSHAFPDIGVSASARGEVYLAGVVYNMDEVPKIKRIARHVEGVRVVHFLHPDLRTPSGPAYFGAIASSDPGVFGAKVEDVISGSPAEKAGIKPGDVIREFNNQTIPDARTLNTQVAACAPGARVEVRIYRGGMDEILGARLLDNTVLAGS
jgi:hypothetical protein